MVTKLLFRISVWLNKIHQGRNSRTLWYELLNTLQIPYQSVCKRYTHTPNFCSSCAVCSNYCLLWCIVNDKIIDKEKERVHSSPNLWHKIFSTSRKSLPEALLQLNKWKLKLKHYKGRSQRNVAIYRRLLHFLATIIKTLNLYRICIIC